MTSGFSVMQLVPFLWIGPFLLVLLVCAAVAAFRLRDQRLPALLTLAALWLVGIETLGATVFFLCVGAFDLFQVAFFEPVYRMVPLLRKLSVGLATLLVVLAAVVRRGPGESE